MAKQMSVYEYRNRNRNCRYCIHCVFDEMWPHTYPCKAKRRDFFFNRARNCPLYEIDTGYRYCGRS